MRLYSQPPDARQVDQHFVKMAKGELRDHQKGQVGFGFAGSRLRYDGSSTLTPEVVVKHQTPTEVGIQQARSEVMANELRKTKAGKTIKKLLAKVSKQKKPVDKGRSIKSGRIEKKKKKKKKTQQQKKKRAKKRSDNFSRKP